MLISDHEEFVLINPQDLPQKIYVSIGFNSLQEIENFKKIISMARQSANAKKAKKGTYVLLLLAQLENAFLGRTI